MRKIFIIFFLLTLAVFSFAQSDEILSGEGIDPENGEEDNPIEFLSDNAYFVNIIARIVTPSPRKILWKLSSSKPTISGRPVKVKIFSKNIVISASITPHKKEDGNILLVAKTKTWSTTQNIKNVLNSVKYLTIKTGEKVVFLPLGSAKRNIGNNTIELEIQILPYAKNSSLNEK